MINLAQKAVIYCRVSTKEQVEEGSSLTTQEKVCREYAEKNGYVLDAIFVEQGESAKTQDRPQLQNLLKYCSLKKNGIKTVIAYKIDRISRNMDDYSQIRLLLKKYGVEIRSTSEQFSDTPVGRFLENTLASISEFDNSIRAERCGNGMKEAVVNGRYVWMAPIGYKNIRVEGKATIAPNPQAPLILQAFRYAAQGVYPVEEIRQMMHTKGLTTPKGNPISKAYFHELLRNRLYTGTIEKFGKQYKGNFDAIVPEDLFEQAQRMLNRKSRRSVVYKMDNEDFPLRRFIKHPGGRKLSGYWSKNWQGKKYAYYDFRQIAQGTFRRESLEKIFMDFFDGFVMPDAVREDFFKMVQEIFSTETKSKRNEKELLQKRLNEIRNRQQLLVEKNLKGIIPDAIATQQLTILGNEELDINAQLYSMDETPPNVTEVLGQAKRFLKKPSEYWLNADLTTKLALQQFAFPQGVIYDGKQMRTEEISLIFKGGLKIIDEKSGLVDYPFCTPNSFVVQCGFLNEILKKNRY